MKKLTSRSRQYDFFHQKWKSNHGLKQFLTTIEIFIRLKPRLISMTLWILVVFITMVITYETIWFFITIVELPPPDCIAVVVGSSGSKSKNVLLSSSLYKCPSKVNKTNWLGVEQDNDLFEVTQRSSTVTATRTNGGGWAMELKFDCCSK